MAEGFRAQFFLIKDVLREEFCRIVSLLASSWVLLSTTCFCFLSFFKDYRFGRIHEDKGCSGNPGRCEEKCHKNGAHEKKAGDLLDKGAGYHRDAGHEDSKEDDATQPIEGFRLAALEPEVIGFSFDNQTESDSASAADAELKAFAENAGIDEAFSSNRKKLQSAFNGRILKVRNFGSPTASPDIHGEQNGDSPTDFSSSVGSNRDMFSEGDTSESSFEEDDFLTEEDFICVKPRPISDYLSLAHTLHEEPKSSDCKNSDEKEIEFSYDFLGEKDEAYERLELFSIYAPSLPASEEESEEEDGDDEISISSMTLEASDLEEELVGLLNAEEACGFILQSNQVSHDHVVDDNPPNSEEEGAIHGSDSPKKQISEVEIRNHDVLAKDAHDASPNSWGSLQYQGTHDQRSPETQKQSPQVLQDEFRNHGELAKDAHQASPNSRGSLQYQGTHDQRSPETQKQSPQVLQDEFRNHGELAKDAHQASPNSRGSLQYQGAHDQSSPETQKQSPRVLQEDCPGHTYSSDRLNYEDENHLNVVEKVEVNHASPGPFESVPDQNDPIIHGLLKSEDTYGLTSDPLIEPRDCNPGTTFSYGGSDDNHIKNTESVSERLEERQVYGAEEEDEEEDELEWLLEHQKMVEEQKMEMRRARGRGLPTILEESEWPKVMDDLKQWKMDNRNLMAAAKEDPLEEMQRFYWSYTDKMRKLDVLNHQKTSSIDFLQLTDTIQFGSAPRATIPALTSLVSQNFRRSGAKKSQIQPSPEFLRELRVDMETVYVGQVCLSWEYLHWQYTRFRDMLDAEPGYGGNFKRAAVEFQTFLVLLTRFIEDEKFKGPRVDNYVKNRCLQRSLLQVPLIKEEKASKLDDGEEDASVDDLVETMEECLRTFWDFVRRDRDEVGTILKGLIGSQTELQDPADAELFANLQANLLKKERRLKDLHRTGNCLVKKFQKHHQGGWMDESLFFSLVDMKLVGRVLRMSRVSSDHLQWCQSKLLKVTFKGRKLVRDPSFLLFPC
ncbi:unnamed protein product [Victoria cruziana]